MLMPCWHDFIQVREKLESFCWRWWAVFVLDGGQYLEAIADSICCGVNFVTMHSLNSALALVSFL